MYHPAATAIATATASLPAPPSVARGAARREGGAQDTAQACQPPRQPSALRTALTQAPNICTGEQLARPGQACIRTAYFRARRACVPRTVGPGVYAYRVL